MSNFKCSIRLQLSQVHYSKNQRGRLLSVSSQARQVHHALGFCKPLTNNISHNKGLLLRVRKHANS